MIDCPLAETDPLESLELELACPVAELEVPVVALPLKELSPPLPVLVSLLVVEPSTFLFEVKPGTAKEDTVGSEASAFTIVWVLDESNELICLLSVLSVVAAVVVGAIVASLVRVMLGLTSFDKDVPVAVGAGVVVPKKDENYDSIKFKTK